MKTYYVVPVVVGALLGFGMASVLADPPGEGVNSAGYVSMDTGAAASRDAMAAQKDADMAPDAAAKAEEAAKPADEARQKSCDAAKAAAGSDAQAMAAAEAKCPPAPVAYNTPNPVGSGRTIATAMGADGRDQAGYYPPKNPIIETKVYDRKSGQFVTSKQELSWGLVESFHQQAQAAGVSPNAEAAIAGNLQHESNAFVSNKWKFDPATGNVTMLTHNGQSSYGDPKDGKYTSFGIAQYHNERATDMLNKTGGTSLSPQGLAGTLNKQYDYLFNDMKKQFSSADYATIMNPNTSVKDATAIFVKKYEIPANEANDLYGRMGGMDRYTGAEAIQQAANAPITPDMTKWGAKSANTKNQNTTFSGANASGANTSGNTGSGTGTSNPLASLLNGGLGATVNQLMGGQASGVLNSLTGSNNSNSGGANGLIAALVESFSGSSSGKGSSSSKGSSTGSSGGSSNSATGSVNGSLYGYDAIVAYAKMCGSDLPPTSSDAMTLMVAGCRNVQTR